MTRNLVSAGSSAVRLGQLLSVCTTNALGRAMIGRRVFNDGSADCDSRAEEFKSTVVDMMVLAGEFSITDFIPGLEWFDLLRIRKMKKLHKWFDAFLTNIIEEHRVSKNENHNDLLSTLLSLKEVQDDEGAALTDVDIKALLLVPHFLFSSVFFWVLLHILLSTSIINLSPTYYSIAKS